MATKKLYFKIGEACKKLDIQPYVLRYWETEFSALSPDKSKSGQRVYTTKDLQVIGRIKELLYEEGFTIAGAKKKLEASSRPVSSPCTAAMEKDRLRTKRLSRTAAEESPAPVVDEASAKELDVRPQGSEEGARRGQGPSGVSGLREKKQLKSLFRSGRGAAW